MMRRLPILIAASFWFLAGSAVFAQSTASASEDTSRTPAFPYLVASLSVGLIMLIVCMPSRKR
jgi:hypothetical protein